MKRLIRKANKDYLTVVKEFRNASPDLFKSVVKSLENWGEMFKESKAENGEKCNYSDFLQYVLKADEDQIIYDALVALYPKEYDEYGDNYFDDMINKFSQSEKEDFLNAIADLSKGSIIDDFEV